MLTLSDINALTNSHDGDIYSDLYKDVYGSRPRAARFESVEAFDADYEFLVKQLNAKNIEDEDRQARNWNKFVARLYEIQSVVSGISIERAIEILADAEDQLEDYKWYGGERLEWHFDLKYGSIKQLLEAA
jgi:hypothetical protein